MFTLGALLIELALQPAIFAVPFFVFAFAVGFATGYGGRGPGILALVASAIVGNVLFNRPIGLISYDVTSVLSTVFFLIFGGVIIYMIDRYRTLVETLRRDRNRRSLLLDGSAALDGSLDFEATLSALAHLAVPRIADWCAVTLLTDGTPKELALAHRDPAKVAMLRTMLERYPVGDEFGVGRVITTKQQWYVSRVSDAELAAYARDADHLAMLRELGFRSCICTPILRNDELIGVLCAAMAESRRDYTDADRVLMAELANRAAIAIERAELYTEAQRQRERAEQASQTKDQFLAILGHELRNPLAPISTALQLMAERDAVTFRRERDVIERQVRQLARLVDDLLDISRIVRGRIELRKEPLDVAEVIARAMETTEPLMNERRQVVRVDVPTGLRVLGDEARLVQVVANLLTNAAKYTQPGGRIDVEGHREDSKVVLRVRDTGVGIAQDMLPRVFDMFVQESQSLDRRRGGLGLGLAIVKNIVQLHGGEVTAASDGIDKGSEFVVRLPALVETAASMSIARRPVAASHDRPVLVVDDNQDALDLLADGLERRGYTTARAIDAPSALAIAADVHPAIALLDIGLPVIDGFELARRLHALDASMHLVAVTGYGQQADLEHAKEAGFEAHLVKPVTLDHVQSTLMRFST